MSDNVQVKLQILGKDYVLGCPEAERATLVDSANYLNRKLQEVKDGGKVVSNERMVVVSALNIIHEYFQYKNEVEKDQLNLNSELLSLQDKISLALSDRKE
ncbi:cell division protein ZapA [Candidatus Albibeggiatoa sp. nov. NOAA]|uniref:cell division protein ZapA n=1 Tax=Candidatus Albibeggiatoa sp. nov. NOAA TaxID=3162724 RepID=UPI0032F4A077|nr:cell division protein ZapA [Thiotrichaceae bacterium]